MKKLLILQACLFIASTIVYSQWSWQNPLPQGNALSTISFFDSSHGWVTGAGGILMCTTDAGKQWKVVHTPLMETILQHSFNSQQSGWLLYYPSNKIYHTTDGGNSWGYVSTPPVISPSNSDDLRSIYFVDDSVGMVGGWYGNVLRTTDAGRTWTPITTGINSIVTSFQFLNSKNGFAFTNSRQVLFTIDAGRTWTPFPESIVFIGNVNKSFFIDAQIGWLAGSRGGDIPYTTIGVLATTTDRGTSWKYATFPNTLMDVYFYSHTEGWVADVGGTIYNTVDGGQTWSKLSGTATMFSFVGRSNAWGILNGSQIKATRNGWKVDTAQTSSITSADLQALTVIDQKNAFACGTNATIIGTSNQGNTWTKLHDSSANISLNGICCKGQDEIWAVGSSSIIFHSTDRGINWGVTKIADTSLWLADITFVNDTLGFIISSGSIGNVYKTVNAGRSWVLIASFPDALNKIMFPKAQLGWIAADHAIFRSTDGGNQWSKASSSSFSLDMCARGDSAWFPYGNTLLFTADAGVTWKTQQVVPVTNVWYDVRSVSFVDSRHGWTTISDGRICKSDDAGFTWSDDSLRTSNMLYGIRFASPDRGWVVGTSGTVLRYDNISTSVVRSNREKGFPSVCFLDQNYPNPFNPTTTISFTLPSKLFVTLKIYDVLGKEVSSLVNEDIPAGTHHRTWNASAMPSGVYFYRLQAGSVLETKRLLLLR
jgi:photosystem II stability/assembly factor-like uncharacterized protein